MPHTPCYLPPPKADDAEMKIKLPLNLINRCRSSAAAPLKSARLEADGSVPASVESFVAKTAALVQPASIRYLDGSKEEAASLLAMMETEGMAKRLPKYENCWLTRTDPADVARVESKTVICTATKKETIPEPRAGVQGALGNWMSLRQFRDEFQGRWQGAMRGRTMYVVPFSMGPLGSRLSKIGVELTDSPYVAASMGVMAKMGADVLAAIGENSDFVRCVHSVGRPLPLQTPSVQNWPCNPEKTQIAHLPDTNEIFSYGSGYGGNSILGKKCLALRLGSRLAQREGWLAEHMLIIGITAPSGAKRYIAAAFPSACGKTNLAMMLPSIPGYKVECVGDDIAWMRFDEKGVLRAINPEAGLFGVAPGTSNATNPGAMDTITRNTLFTNVAETDDGGVYWEGLEDELPPGTNVTDWQGQPWTADSGRKAAHPNSRFCVPIDQVPSLDPAALDPDGVPISAILLGGRRPSGVPLVVESLSWEHGVFMGAAMRSEATSAAEHKAKTLMHDPFAMRPFFGYNFGHYLQHWLHLPNKNPGAQLPKIYGVNWFRKGDKGFLWPGFGENARVLDWVMRRLEGEEDSGVPSPIGVLPKKEHFNLDGLKEEVDWPQLFSVPKDFWLQEADAVLRYFDEQVGEDLPQEMRSQVAALKHRLNNSNA